MTGAYLCGALLMLARLVAALRGGQRLRRRAEPVTEAHILHALSRQARRLGLRRVNGGGGRALPPAPAPSPGSLHPLRVRPARHPGSVPGVRRRSAPLGRHGRRLLRALGLDRLERGPVADPQF
jgi:hypothetical protein